MAISERTSPKYPLTLRNAFLNLGTVFTTTTTSPSIVLVLCITISSCLSILLVTGICWVSYPTNETTNIAPGAGTLIVNLPAVFVSTTVFVPFIFITAPGIGRPSSFAITLPLIITELFTATLPNVKFSGFTFCEVSGALTIAGLVCPFTFNDIGPNIPKTTSARFHQLFADRLLVYKLWLI